jgi:hypothetical protein
MNFCKVFFSKLIKTCDVHLFGDIIGYDHIKRVFGMALDADCVVHILLVGPPASAKKRSSNFLNKSSFVIACMLVWYYLWIWRLSRF